MAQHFTLAELTRSDTADRMRIANTPNHDEVRRLNHLMDNCLDPIRKAWGKPIGVNSGYRCLRLNEAVGGAPTSQHLKGEAADITTGSKEGNRRLFELIQSLGVDFDQLIDESGYKWLHISCTAQGNRRQILHL